MKTFALLSLALLNSISTSHAQTAGVTVQSSLYGALQLRPAPRTSTLNDVYALLQSGERGGKVYLTCAVTLESLQAAFDGNDKKVRKFVEKWPTGFEITFARTVSFEIGRKFTGTITAKPQEMQAKPSMTAQFIWDLYAQTTGGLQFLETSRNGGSDRAGICAQPARIVSSETGEMRIGVPNRATPEAAFITTAPATADSEPSLWRYRNGGKESLFCGYDDILAAYERHHLDLVCDYGSHSAQR